MLESQNVITKARSSTGENSGDPIGNQEKIILLNQFIQWTIIMTKNWTINKTTEPL